MAQCRAISELPLPSGTLIWLLSESHEPRATQNTTNGYTNKHLRCICRYALDMIGY
jgi:hypothetical protein